MEVSPLALAPSIRRVRPTEHDAEHVQQHTQQQGASITNTTKVRDSDGLSPGEVVEDEDANPLLSTRADLIYDIVRYRIHHMRKNLKDELDDRDTVQHYEQLKPLIALLDRIKDLSFPDFGSLQDWERATIGASANGAVGSSQNSEGLCSWTPMPFLEETEEAQVHKNLLNLGTDLMEEQKGENSSSANLDQSSEAKSDKKQCSEEDGSKSIQESYIKAYYEAIQKRQEEKAKSLACISDQPFASDAQFERQLGAKSKRDDDGESGDDDIELKVEQPTGNTGEIYKLADLNVETQQSNDDEYEWQEG
ncbi:hypothetical protein E2562_037911 [Oryza meyeriana var. granulata]|uniref:Uncharacterized protein n=1 Tax=Oryza meyeriana var. granulata TaxID=110450 RepID=A0A6G1EU07_9ORYZ|nr:hypothetical protein E2562_037911 [Oryza meyeriana var. granulata]